MKVWEAIAILSKCEAGADMYVNLGNTNTTNVLDIEVDGDNAYVRGGDAQLMDEDGNEYEYLSDIAADKGANV